MKSVCFYREVATITQCHYKFPNLLLSVCRQGHYVWQLRISDIFLTGIFRASSSHFIRSIMIGLNLWVCKVVQLTQPSKSTHYYTTPCIVHINRGTENIWSVVTWQRFQDVYMDPFTSVQDFRVLTLATQPFIIEAIRSISNSYI